MSLQPKRCLFNTHSAFIMDLPVSSFVYHSSLLTAKSVDLVVVHNGLLSQWKSLFFIVVTLITKEFFEQLLIRTAVYITGYAWLKAKHCRYFSFQLATAPFNVVCVDSSHNNYFQTKLTNKYIKIRNLQLRRVWTIVNWTDTSWSIVWH